MLACGALALGLGACTTDDDAEQPTACAADPEAVLAALDRAPEPVTLDGTPISACFVAAGDAGALQSVGFALTEAAVELAPAARADPQGEAALQLGYLVGAARAGAERKLVYDELVRRLEQELQGVETDSSAFRMGERAGRESG